MSSPTEAADPGSIWCETARHPDRTHSPLEGRIRTDVVVIGGGYCGLSAALHLAERGVSAVLLEAHAIGHGASGRNGGQVNPGLRLGQVELERRFGEAGSGLHALGETAPDFVAELIERHRLDCGFRRPGTLRLAHSEQAMETARRTAEELAARGVAARLLDCSAAAELTGSDAYRGGLLDPRGGSLHPLDFCRELARVAEDAGAGIYEWSPAERLVREANGWTVTTPKGRVHADSVVVATNAYSGPLVPKLACSVLPVNRFQIATAPLPAHQAATVLPGGQAAFDSRRLILYFRKTAEGRVVLGGRASFTSRLGSGARTPDYGVLEKTLHEIFPITRSAGIEKRWTGLVCITPDFVPHYHASEPGLHILLGFNGRGVAAATRAGAWLAGRIAGSAEADVSIPSSPITPIPFHSLRAPVLDAVMRWGLLMDRLGR